MKELLSCLLLFFALAFIVYGIIMVYKDSKKAQIEREARIKAYNNVVTYLPLINQKLSELGNIKVLLEDYSRNLPVNLPDMNE